MLAAQVPASMLLLFLPILGQALVTSAEDCPPANVVDARVRTILGLGEADVIVEQAEVGRDDASLRIVLRSQDGLILGERSVRADGTCEELAGVAAVVLATWLSDVHPEFVGSLPSAAAEQPAPAAVAAPAPPPPRDRGPVQPEPAPAAKGPRSSTHHFAFGAALGGDFSAARPAPLASLGARWLPHTTGFGWALTASVTGPLDQALGSGSVQYWRWPLATGPVLRVALSSTTLDFHAGGALAWLHLKGESLEQPETHDSPLGAIFASARVSHDAGTLMPFAELFGIGWPDVRPYLGPSGREVSLPRVELYLALGASFTAR